MFEKLNDKKWRFTDRPYVGTVDTEHVYPVLVFTYGLIYLNRERITYHTDYGSTRRLNARIRKSRTD